MQLLLECEFWSQGRIVTQLSVCLITSATPCMTTTLVFRAASTAAFSAQQGYKKQQQTPQQQMQTQQQQQTQKQTQQHSHRDTVNPAFAPPLFPVSHSAENGLLA